MFRLSNSGTLNGGTKGLNTTLIALANASPVVWPSPHPQVWNVAGVDYPIGPDATKAAAWKDPATNTPTNCTYYTVSSPPPGGNTNGSTLVCTGAFAIDGYELGPVGGHGCTYVRVAVAATTWSVTNSHIVNDSTCNTTSIQTVFQNTNGTSVNISNNLIEGGWSGFTGYVQGTATTTPTAYLLPQTDQQIIFAEQKSGGGVHIHWRLQTTSTPACTTSDPYFSAVTPVNGETNRATRGSNTYVCVVTDSSTANFQAGQTASPNIDWTPIVSTDKNATTTLQYNVYLHMPSLLGSISPEGGTHVDRWSFAYGINEAASAHTAWYASTYPLTTTGSAPTLITKLEYAYNTSIFPATLIPGSGSTVFSNLMQQGFVTETTLNIIGNTAVTNAWNSSIPGFTQTTVGQAGLFYASEGQILNLTIRDNWLDVQGASSCFTTDNAGHIAGSVAGTTLTVTDASAANVYVGERLNAGTFPTITAQLTNTNGSGYPNQEGTYSLSSSQSSASSASWTLYNTGVTTQTISNNNALTRALGSGAVTLDTTSQNWGGGACPDHG